MFSITMHGEAFGRLASNAISRMAAVGSELKRTVARFQTLLEATVILKRRGKSLPNKLKGEGVASAFHQAAIDELSSLHARQAGGSRSDQ